MKVLCVSVVTVPNRRLLLKGIFPKIVEGEVYEVASEAPNSYELTFELGHWYHKKLFVPLSEIDETTLVNQKTETV